jgi:hypothetical protein
MRPWGEEEATGINVLLAVAIVFVHVQQRPIQAMNGSAGRADRGSRPAVQIDHRLDVVGAVPVVGIEVSNGVEPLVHRRKGADGPRRIAKIFVGPGKNDMFRGPRQDVEPRRTVGDQKMRASVALPSDAIVTRAENVLRFLVVGRDYGDAKFPRQAHGRSPFGNANLGSVLR